MRRRAWVKQILMRLKSFRGKFIIYLQLQTVRLPCRSRLDLGNFGKNDLVGLSFVIIIIHTFCPLVRLQFD